MAEIRKGFATPPEVVSYFDGKALKPAFSWLDVWGEEHAYGFTVAKATETELLTAFKSSISKALASGQGFDNWKKDVSAELARLGWFGPRMVSDPSGVDPDRMVDFSSPRRLRTIFWSNMNAARAAGQWERAQRSKRVLPYILYVRTTSNDPRPEHLGWVGVILPVDHPFWNTHWPPNGWLCKCQVRQISTREAEQLLGREAKQGGILYRSKAPDLGPDIAHRNRRTGEITMVPPGIDPGWQTNPGLARASSLIANLETRLASADPVDAGKAVRNLWEDPFLRLAPTLPEKTWLPAGVSLPLQQQFEAKSPVVSVTSEAIADRVKRHKMEVKDFAVLPDLIEHGTVLPDPRGKANVRSIFHRDGKTWWRAFLTMSVTGFLRITSLHQKQEKEVRAYFQKTGTEWKD